MVNACKITSKCNTKIKFVSKLHDGSKRRRAGLFIVEGFREVTRAFESGVSFDSLFFCSDFFKNDDFKKLVDRAGMLDVDLFDVSSSVFEKISIRNGHDGILALCNTWDSDISAMNIKENSLFLVVDGIEKSGNLGALMRSAESANADAMIVCNPVTDIFNHNVIRVSQGALFALPIFLCNREEVYENLHKNNVKILCTSPASPTRYWNIDMRNSTAIVVGSEHDGLSEFWLKNHGVTTVSIPQLGRSDSLNVNDAAVVVLYEAIRQRYS